MKKNTSTLEGSESKKSGKPLNALKIKRLL